MCVRNAQTLVNTRSDSEKSLGNIRSDVESRVVVKVEFQDGLHLINRDFCLRRAQPRRRLARLLLLVAHLRLNRLLKLAEGVLLNLALPLRHRLNRLLNLAFPLRHRLLRLIRLIAALEIDNHGRLRLRFFKHAPLGDLRNKLGGNLSSKCICMAIACFDIIR